VTNVHMYTYKQHIYLPSDPCLILI
jgi:hypothetical protein